MPKMDQDEAQDLLDEWYKLEFKREEYEYENYRINERAGDDYKLTRGEQEQIKANNAQIAKIDKQQKEIVKQLKAGHAFGL